jgi:HK97 family phage major capsid protein
MSAEQILNAINELNTVFHEYKKTNDEKIKALETGKATAELEQKLVKLQDAYQTASENIANLEKEMAAGKRPGFGTSEDPKAKIKEFAAALAKWDEAKLAQFRNDVSTSSDGSGGYAVPSELDSVVDAYLMADVAMLSICNVKNFAADYSKLVTVTGGSVANSTELATVSKGSTGTIVKVSPVNGKKVAKQLISEESKDDLIFDPESWVRENIAMVMAEDLETELITGLGENGATKGFLKYTMSTDQDSARDFGKIQQVLSGKSGAFLELNTTTHVNPVDKLKDMRTALKGMYRRNARWLFNRFTEGEIMKLKDANENYILKPQVAVGQESLLLGYPMTISDSMPDIAADSLSIAFGDFKRGITIQIRPGLYIVRDNVTAYPNIYLNFSKRYGLMLRDSRAIKVMKFASA